MSRIPPNTIQSTSVAVKYYSFGEMAITYDELSARSIMFVASPVGKGVLSRMTIIGLFGSC